MALPNLTRRKGNFGPYLREHEEIERVRSRSGKLPSGKKYEITKMATRTRALRAAGDDAGKNTKRVMASVSSLNGKKVLKRTKAAEVGHRGYKEDVIDRQGTTSGGRPYAARKEYRTTPGGKRTRNYRTYSKVLEPGTNQAWSRVSGDPAKSKWEREAKVHKGTSDVGWTVTGSKPKMKGPTKPHKSR